MFRCLLVPLFCALGLMFRAQAAEEAPLSRYEHVTVAAAKTSIYVGSVTLTTPGFIRKDGAYESTYTARVFPYLFYNEAGVLSVEMSDVQLRQLERGETVNFTGRAVRADGVERRVEGRAAPTDPITGKLKVRVFVSKRTELIFNTTYRFGAPSPSAP